MENALNNFAIQHYRSLFVTCAASVGAGLVIQDTAAGICGLGVADSNSGFADFIERISGTTGLSDFLNAQSCEVLSWGAYSLYTVALLSGVVGVKGMVFDDVLTNLMRVV